MTALHEHSVRAVGRMRAGDHFCLPYTTDAGRGRVVAAFVRDGLAAGDQVLYLADTADAPAVLAFLRQQGIDADPDITGGRLAVETADQTYLVGGFFDPDRMMDSVRAAVSRATTAGCRGLRVVEEMSWVLRDVPGTSRLGEYETKLRQVFKTGLVTGICQYDLRRFAPETLAAVERLHLGRVKPDPRTAGPDAVPPSSVDSALRITRTVAPPGIRVAGEIDLATYPALDDALRSLVCEVASGDIHIELAEVDFIDVAGTRLLVATAAGLHAERRLILHEPPPELARVTELAGWDQVYNLVIQGS